MAVQICRDLNVDVIKRGSSRVVYAKQNDVNSRFLNVRIQEDGADMNVKSTWSVMFNVTRSDNLSDVFKGSVNEDGTVKVPLTAWMLELEGTLVCDISLVSDDPEVAKLTTMSFNIYVEGAAVSDATITEKEEYSVIVDLLTRTADTEAKTRALYDDIANKYTNGEFDGKSAYDYAKEKGYTGTEEEFAEEMALCGNVGQEIDALKQHANDKNNPHNLSYVDVGAAPDGFGLGGNCRICRDCNEAYRSGFYYLANNCANAPDIGYLAPMIVMVADEYIIQIVNNGTRSVQRRGYMDGTLAEADFESYGGWKWNNPPMVEGVTYLTTEQWKGKDVYTKLFTFGKLPDGTSDTKVKSVSIGKNLLNVRVDGFVYKGDYTIPIQILQKVESIYYHKSDGLVSIQVGADYSDWTACLVIKWTN